MQNLKSILKWRNFLSVIVILFVAGLFVKNVESTSDKKIRPDIINIDFMKTFGDLERPLVVFLHGSHTSAIERAGGDCKTCHKIKDGKLSQIFMECQYTNGKDAMDTFHDNCIGCHKDIADKNQNTGPVACADCHNSDPEVLSSRQPMGIDNSLHSRHVKAYDKKCEVCHSDCKTNKYKKGEETTCRHCHDKKQAENNVISLEHAVHDSCINCHMARQAEKKSTGPVKCGGCHDLEAQKSIEKVFPVPRMDRNQPDVLKIKTGSRELDEPGKNRMNFVAFNHKAHENDNDTCRACHHKSMSACNTCHTLEGSKDSNGVSLEQAMHKMDRDQSCTGCHKKKQDDIKCAGCHVALSKTEKLDDVLCLKCHNQALSDEGMDKNTARMIIEQRAAQAQLFDIKDIPENIILKGFADKYKPVNFPHGKIVNTIVRNIKDNKLAEYFHADKGTLCQGCHHNSPATDKPTRCKSCHGKPFNEKKLNRPGIIGAYHILCMGCHTNMKIDLLSCTDCHEEKE